ncbi:auxilin-like clathrin-binding protein required for normal clathrin function [Aspergillus melleus]|uniref:Auxilin-like clathrin-binding protein required for normal clathrin function n=1 Tax=Aspergillus melleus TaxID=138277 RepID=A0ACC3B0N1_9EURO|nr:auxilin-like clathrin-binding protein required for normal clathrin function [Aspergillus melleus]
MDDLSGLSWSASSSNAPQKPPPMSSSSLFPNVRPANPSGRSTPLSASSTASNPPAKPATSDKDSFANLVSFNSSNSNKNVPLVEQQRRLQEERARKEAENRSRFESQYGGQNSQFWDSLEKGGSGKSSGFGATTTQQKPQSPDEDDILAAFDASAPVDASTHFPVPSPSPSPQVGTSSPQLTTNGAPSAPPAAGGMDFMDDDDPFGLNQLKPKQQAPPAQPASTNDDDDDFLGLLGKPVSELPPKPPAKSPTPPSMRESPPPPPPSKGSSGIDRAVAELVDMGFPADKSAQALRMTPTGTDIQAAVSLLLTQAHEESRQRSRNRPTPDDLHPDHSGRSRDQSARSDRNVPSWMQQERAHTPRSRSSNRSPMSADKDPAQVASAFGNNLLKTANSLWKSGSKKVQQVVQDFNTEQDPNQPKWLREASMHEEPSPDDRRQAPGHSSRAPPAEFTNEALLLESGGDPRASRRPDRSHEARPPPRSDSASFRNQPSPPVGERRAQQPAFLREQMRSESRDPRVRVSKTAVEQQSAQAYVSPARRKRPVAPSPAPEPAVDFFDSPAPSSSAERPKPASSPAQAQPSRSSTPAKPLPSRPKALPPRAVPPLSQEALSSTHRHKDKGAEAYKRGDYGSAHESFSTALSMLPEKHPLTIIVRSNRAMTALKIGEPKVAISDADSILEVIGPSKGEAESIELGNGEPNKPMKDFFGKALMRKAEALEQLERWVDAAQSWRQAVENGHGGSTSIQGRNRCEKAAGISKPTLKPSAPARRPAAPAPKRPSALADLQGGSASSGMDSAAVSRLRAANQAAEQADEEKFALTESVDARLAAWKNGKQDNLRALLGSLDTVLWPESGWKKINMSELIMPNKVKVQYMKGIAKVHPDKISTTATTEQRMISSAVFGALNEAWDKFKKENNL